MSDEWNGLTRRAALRGAAVAGAASLVRPAAGLGLAARPHPACSAARSDRSPASRARSRRRSRSHSSASSGRPRSRRRSSSGRGERATGPGAGGRRPPFSATAPTGRARKPARPSSGRRSGPARPTTCSSAAPVASRGCGFTSSPRRRRRKGTAATAHAAQALPLAQPVLDAGPGQPPIIARAAWAQGHAPPSHVPLYGTVKLAFVHHSETPNGYSAGRGPLDPAVDLRLSPLRPRLLRHRLQLRDRRVRPDLGGAGRWRRSAGDRRPRRRLQPGVDRAWSCSARS